MKIFGSPKKERIWSSNDDGTPYVIGMTVGELKNELKNFNDGDEVCMAVCQKKNWNGGGWLGKLKAIEAGSTGQMWLKALVLDESQE
jgi:hypothetical protein